MRPLIAALLFMFSALAAAAVWFDLPYWALPPNQKFASSWANDLTLLERTQHLPKEWSDLKEITFSSNESAVYSWYQASGVRLDTKPTGKYKLEILALHQINGYRYGVMLQYNWIDLATGNTIGELGRTLKLGIVY